jgi:hypothetical protein
MGNVLGILPGKPSQSATLVVAAHPNLLGLNGATGQCLWRCPIRDAESLLPMQDPLESPWMINHGEGSTICRRALATTESGDYLPHVGKALSDLPARDDPRVVRRLPWLLLAAAACHPSDPAVFCRESGFRGVPGNRDDPPTVEKSGPALGSGLSHDGNDRAPLASGRFPRDGLYGTLLLARLVPGRNLRSGGHGNGIGDAGVDFEIGISA